MNPHGTEIAGIAPDTWGNKRNFIADAQRGTLVVRQKPDVLREIDRFLTTILMAMCSTVPTTASRAAW